MKATTYRRSASTVALLVAMACGTAQDATPDRGAPDAAMAQLESRLLTAKRVELDYHVTAEGLLRVDITGRLVMEAGHTSLRGRGTFGADSVDLNLVTAGDSLFYGNGPERLAIETPPELRQALVIGLTRMGILHNLARLTANHPPDHAEGGAAEWVVLGDFAWEPDGGPMSFSLTVSGEPAGRSTLEFDQYDNPAFRRQSVQFTEGEMRVVERYKGVVITRPS